MHNLKGKFNELLHTTSHFQRNSGGHVARLTSISKLAITYASKPRKETGGLHPGIFFLDVRKVWSAFSANFSLAFSYPAVRRSSASATAQVLTIPHGA